MASISCGKVYNKKDQKMLQKSSKKNDRFKATKIWNEVLHEFYLGIQLKRHWQNMKTYEDCFTAQEAVTWLKNYIPTSEHFNQNKVTRLQALNLLQKYYKLNIIEKIKSNNKDKEIKDDGELLRFTVDASEYLPFLMATKSQEDLLKSCQNDNGSLSSRDSKYSIDLREKVDVYKRAMWVYMNRLFLNISDYIKVERIDGQFVLKNITKVNSNGVVQLTDKNEDLPHWILSAMKCLANWPKASGSGNCLPKYPGFEYDVFNLVREYFVNMEEPIIPYVYYQLFIVVYDLYIEAECSKNIENENLSKFALLLTSTKTSLNIDSELGLPKNCVYETVFSGKNPVTKIVPIDELSNVFPDFLNYFKQANSTLKSSNQLVHSPFTNNNINLSKFSAISYSNQKENLTPKPLNTSWSSQAPCSKFSGIDSPPESGEYMMNKNFNNNKFRSLPQQESTAKSLKKNLSKLNFNSDSVVTKSNRYYELLQSLLLILPCSNRRYLQLLSRLFYKILHNKELCLLTKDVFTLKEHIVNIFTRCILRSEQEKNFDETKSKNFVSFLIDECMDIFKVPQGLINEVEKIMNDVKNSRKTQVSIPSDYCRKITNDEYEMQRDTMSEVALIDLLESIMSDDSISERDKLKWIKQFKMYHPGVFELHLPNFHHKKQSDQQKKSYRRAFSSTTTTTTTAGFQINSLPQSKVLCYECESIKDPNCADPFNTSYDMSRLKECEGCCVKVVLDKNSPRKNIWRTCTSRLHINLFMVDHVCMDESGGRGHMCFCESDGCNRASSLGKIFQWSLTNKNLEMIAQKIIISSSQSSPMSSLMLEICSFRWLWASSFFRSSIQFLCFICIYCFLLL